MTGDQADIVARLKRLLPNWFGQDAGPTPVLDALLEGPAWALSFVFGLIEYTRLQIRLRTLTGGWIDLAAEDFFGDELRRKAFEADDVYRDRFRSALFEPSNTRKAISDAVEAIAGVAPRIIQPWNPSHTGRWGAMYWGVDTLTCPFRWTSAQSGRFFLEVSIPPASVAGWGRFPSWNGFTFWNSSSFYWVDLSSAQQAVGTAIIERVKALKADGVMALISFTGRPTAGYAPRWDVAGYAWDTGNPPRWDHLPPP